LDSIFLTVVVLRMITNKKRAIMIIFLEKRLIKKIENIHVIKSEHSSFTIKH